MEQLQNMEDKVLSAVKGIASSTEHHSTIEFSQETLARGSITIYSIG